MIVVDSKENHSRKIARNIADEILLRQKLNKNIVLGLATGSTPILLYTELVRLHIEEQLSFKNVITFNLDEYCGLCTEDDKSYYHFMHKYLFNHIDIPSENIFIPSGQVEQLFLKDYCEGYEHQIQKLGGIDIQILGIGRSGHIGFNEPGSEIDSVTRQVKLHEVTRNDASEDFNGLENTPTHAITMGMQTIMNAKKIFFMAFGESKKEITKKAFFGEITDALPASHLQKHKHKTICLDFNIR